MTHLTLTGYEAGRIICGAPKTADNQYLHAMYAPIDKLSRGEIDGYSALCPKCLELWEEAGTAPNPRCPTCNSDWQNRRLKVSDAPGHKWCEDKWHTEAKLS